MSRRFGRNQRRRMREQVAQLQTGMEMDRALLRRQSGEIANLGEQIDRAKRMVGPHSALFDPEKMRFEGRARRSVQSYAAPQLPSFSMATMDDPILSEPIRQIPLDVMLASVNPDHLAEMQHLRIEFGDGRWGYAISRQAMTNMPHRDLVSLVARELAQVIASAMKTPPAHHG